jgi:hypothetical protein
MPYPLKISSFTMAEFIPEVVPTSEYDSKTVEVTSVKNDYMFQITLDDLYDIADDYANWVYFGVGGPA